MLSGELPSCDAALRLVEGHVVLAVFGVDQLAGLQRLSVTNPQPKSLGCARVEGLVGIHPMRRFQGNDLAKEPRMVVTFPHVHRVGVHACADHEERFWFAAHVQALSLPHREEVGAVVCPYHLAHVGLQGEGA